ncbi:hypothetical protein B0H16DRAFT_1478764 [Mycena metata]|uniref:Uncharacterized protein n=1 Tax=Mycena metata TaxID=1033252 RepID=A0AAD7H7C0_9AGAR|nr:hypothetical protein B0H16DRAFT_1478764 [Mycena metata]
MRTVWAIHLEWDTAGKCLPGCLASWQDFGESGVDFMIVSESLLPLVRKFKVTCPTVFEEDDWSDHIVAAKGKKLRPGGAGIFRPDSPLNMVLTGPGPENVNADRAHPYSKRP